MVLSIPLFVFLPILSITLAAIYFSIKNEGAEYTLLPIVVFGIIFSLITGAISFMCPIDKLTVTTELPINSITKTPSGTTIIEFYDLNNQKHTLTKQEASYYLVNTNNIHIFELKQFNTYNYPLEPTFNDTIKLNNE